MPKPNTYFIFNQIGDKEALFNFVETTLNMSKMTLKGLVLICESNPIDYLENLPKGYTLKKIKETNFGVSFKLNKIIKHSEQDKNYVLEGSVILIKTEKPNVYLLLTLQNNRFLDFVLVPLIESYRKNLAVVKFSSVDLENAMKNLQKLDQNALIIASKVIAYTSIEEDYGFLGNKLIKLKNKKYREVEIKYTKQLISSVFSTAKESGAWIDKLGFTYYLPKTNEEYYSMKFQGFISRKGTFKFDKEGKIFYNILLLPLIERAQKLFELYNNKERLQNNKILQARPLEITFDYNIFEDKNQVNKLINVLRNFERSSLSVLHNNPFLYGILVDYTDASSYDIVIGEPNKLVVTPQLKASLASLNRIMSQISGKFKEGKVEERG